MKIMIKLLLFMTVLYTQSDTVIQDGKRQPNKLINATSPYLLQHAYNPVDWNEWGEEALERAKKENKPILVSIGYSACHWCHVMAHESFENNDIAAIMNEFFINIKIDREERPDVDKVYMDAVHAMGINGGWPLNVFITPDQKPFFGGTYFPPEKWAYVLNKVAKAYREEQAKINQSASALAARLAKSDLDLIPQNQPADLTQKNVHKIYAALKQKFDNKWGGMLKTPKFVLPTQWMFLLRHYYNTKEADALSMVELTLNRMAMGGLYDQVGGGFARYAVDERWFAPHFEKMLYDNAQLLSLYSEAYAVTHNDMYRRVVYETVAWLEQEMTNAEGGFYAAMDADSEGEEGKFYVWKKEEFDSLLRGQPSWIADYYTVSKQGNWEHGNNILFIKSTDKDFMASKKITANQLASSLQQAKIILHNTREKRIKPGLDDKVLAGWNAMMIDGLLNAYSVFGAPQFLALAQRNMVFIEKNLMDKKLYRSFKGKRSPVEGFLEDYAFLIRAYIALYQATFEVTWLKKAQKWMDYTQLHFFDEKEGFYFFSGKSAEQLIASKKEVFDNVIPSSNSVMARNLYHLGILLDEKKYNAQAMKMVARMSKVIHSEPSFMSHWAILYAEMVHGMAEIVIVGDKFREVAQDLRKKYIPFALFMGASSKSTLPLVKGKVNRPGKGATIYVCFNKTCKRPVYTVAEALVQLNNR